jgi:hypothetical protein
MGKGINERYFAGKKGRLKSAVLGCSFVGAINFV